MMRLCVLLLSVCCVLSACGKKTDSVVVSDGYSYVTPAGMSIAAVFLTIDNPMDVDDRMIGFKTDQAARAELHTMSMQGDRMQMRRVDFYPVPAGGSHVLQQGGDHIMVFGMKQSFKAGDSYDAVAIFEKSGELPITIHVRSRDDMNMGNK